MDMSYFDLEQELYRLAHSEDPNERCCAVFEGADLDELKNDECWLVRHSANRALILDELQKRSGYSPNFPDDYPYLDISDAAYELYKHDWLRAHTTFDSCVEDIREWTLRMEDFLSRGGDTCRFNAHMVTNAFGEEEMLSYNEFCGFAQPNCIGLYHNKEYIAELFGYDAELLALYKADINDDFETRFSIDARLRAAREVSEATFQENCETRKDELEKRWF